MNNFKNLDLKIIGALTSKPYAFRARFWELESLDFIDIFDGMLSNITLDIRGLNVMRVLPRINELLNEEWISDKVRFSYDGYRRQRLVSPLIKDLSLSKYREITWESSFFYFFLNYNLYNYDYINVNNTEAVLGRFVDFESTVIFKDFFTNMSSSNVNISYQDKSFFDNYLLSNFIFNNNYTQLENLNVLLIIGSNLRFENPLLHLKINRCVSQGLIVFSSMLPSNMKFKNYSLGNNIKSLLNFMEGKDKYSIILSKAKNKLVILGESLRQRVDGKYFSRFLYFIKNINIYISAIHSNVSRLNFLDVGFSSNYLTKENLNSNFLFLYNVDEINFLKKINLSFIVYQGHHGDKGSSLADLILPSTFAIERKGTFLSMNGFFSKYRFVLKPNSSVRTDWRIFSALIYYFRNNLQRVVYNFFELAKRCEQLVPSYKFQKKIDGLDYRNLVYFDKFSFANTVCFSFFIDYYVSDIVSRSSRVMALASLRFKNYYFNF